MKLFKAVIFLACMFVAAGAFAQSSAELKRRREKLSDELEQLNREYQETASNKKVSLKQLNILKAQINLREEKIANINSEVRNLDNQISESNNTVRNLQSQLDQLKKEYAGMVLFAYRNQSAYNKLMFIFAAKDFNQAYRRLKYLQQFGTYRERQAGYIQGTQRDLHVKINELDKDKREKNNLLASQEKEKVELGKAKNDQVKVISDLSKQQGAIKQQQRDIRKRIAQTNRAISAAISREIEIARREAEEKARAEARAAAARAKAENREVAATKPAITKSSTNSQVLNATPEAARLSNDFLGNRGRLPWPVANGQLLHGFGTYTDADGIRNESSGYEIRTGANATIRAVFDGEVRRVIDVAGSYTVILKHGEYFTSYSNLKSVTVNVGQHVSTKQAIGTVAADPSTGDPTVSFTLNKGKEFLNPKSWLADN